MSQATKLLVVPVAEAARDEFVERIGTEIGGAAAGGVTGFVRRLSSGSDSDIRALSDEVAERPQQATELKLRLETGLGVELDRGEEEVGAHRGMDSFLVDAYEATLWRIAMMALWEDCWPIAVRGALQGEEWLTVCQPGYELRTGGIGGRRPDAIKPADMWRRAGAVIHRGLFEPPVEFFVKRASSETGVSEVADLNRAFRREPNRHFEPVADAPLDQRWHRVDGAHSLWVHLEPDGAATTHIVRTRGNVTDFSYQPPEYSEYPDEWRQVLDIPDESAGLHALNEGADRFAHENETLRSQAQNVMARMLSESNGWIDGREMP